LPVVLEHQRSCSECESSSSYALCLKARSVFLFLTGQGTDNYKDSYFCRHRQIFGEENNHGLDLA